MRPVLVLLVIAGSTIAFAGTTKAAGLQTLCSNEGPIDTNGPNSASGTLWTCDFDVQAGGVVDVSYLYCYDAATHGRIASITTYARMDGTPVMVDTLPFTTPYSGDGSCTVDDPSTYALHTFVVPAVAFDEFQWTYTNGDYGISVANIQVMGVAAPGVDAPTGVKSCQVYNQEYSPSPYPGQDNGFVVENNPSGPEGDQAFCFGAATGAPCQPGEPGVIFDNAPICLADPCPQSIDPNTVAACGVGPECPSGLTSPPAPGQLLVVCGKAVSGCSLSGAGPGPGWGIGAAGVCIGLPWVEQGAAPCPGATINERVFWGTTPGFAPGSTTDVCV
ncbi:MAG: hypothetical protein QOE90_1093 [Thermoplasmata archaeon]|nr:hypothetical protein [Thermoplasmata archaeon]